MANNYQQFSVMISGLTEEEKAWLEKVDELIYAAPETYVDLGNPEEVAMDDDQVEAMQAFKAIAGEYYDVVSAVAYNDDCEKRYIGQREFDEHWWLYEEEGCDLDGVAEYISQFFKRWRPTEFMLLTWAFTCSKMRVDEFGGGSMLITADWYRAVPIDYILSEVGNLYSQSKSQGITPKFEDLFSWTFHRPVGVQVPEKDSHDGED